MTRARHGIRLFRNDGLEALTHVPPFAPVALYGALAVAAAAWALRAGVPPARLMALALAGAATWTLFEYVTHRFVFHTGSERRWLRALAYLCHGVHHDDPWDRTRLVLPLPLSLATAATLAAAHGLLLGARHGAAAFAGFLAAYVAYDCAHLAAHLGAGRGRLRQAWRRYHLSHHFEDPRRRFGVSSGLWDRVFRTR